MKIQSQTSDTVSSMLVLKPVSLAIETSFQSDLVVIDVETTTKNKGHPFDPDNFLVSYSYSRGSQPPVFKHYLDPDFIRCLTSVVSGASILVGFNIKFDLHWIHRAGVVVPLETRVWDCQLAEFILSGQTLAYDSLNAAAERYGLPLKKDAVAEYWDAGIDTPDIPVPVLEEYGNHDVHLTKMLFDVQQQLLPERQKRLVWLEGEDLKALQSAEFAGIKWDAERAQASLDTLNARLSDLNAQMQVYLPDGIPEGKFNWDSGDHLSAVLYGGVVEFKHSISEEAVYKSGDREGQPYIKNRWFTSSVGFKKRFNPIKGTLVKKCTEPGYSGTLFYQTGADILVQLKTRSQQDRKLLELLATRAQAIKVAEMIESVFKKMKEKNWQDNYIHGQFNQNVVITGRLSSSQPNLQNTPPEVDQLLISRYND